MEIVIEVQHLTRRFGDIVAVNDFSFEVRHGEVLALLGPNGAGKTTTVRLVNGLFEPTQGQIRVMGLDPVRQGQAVRQQTGVLTETPALYERLTAWQNLEFFGTMEGMSRQEWHQRGEELLAFFELQERADERVGTYSKGMKQRLALVRALLHKPSLLFLDEPTAGLDPEAALQVHELIDSIRKTSGQTVVLCTHNLVEAQRLCDRMAILNKGKMLALGSLEELGRQYAAGIWVEINLFSDMPDGVFQGLGTINGVLQVRPAKNRTLQINVQEQAVIPALAAYLVRHDVQLLAIKPQEISLEDIYFRLQEQSRGGAA
jgi:ABC-2 type transport system ATP-binding protein